MASWATETKCGDNETLTNSATDNGRWFVLVSGKAMLYHIGEETSFAQVRHVP